jgi:hypothetical protein
MDPTQVLIELLNALQELEDEHEDNPAGEAAELARTEAIGKLNALSEWLGPLNGFPPKISTIDLDADPDDEEDE